MKATYVLSIQKGYPTATKLREGEKEGRGKGEGKERVGKGELGGEKKRRMKTNRREKDRGKRKKRGEPCGDFKKIIECNTDVSLSG